MTVLVAVETVLLVLLVVLVAGLLRSHAEILRRLGPEGAADGADSLPPPEARPQRGDVPPPAIGGMTPDGDALKLDFDGAATAPTLLAFLTSGCTTCAGFWETLSEPRLPTEIQTVIVTHGSERERPRRLRQLAPPDIPVIMSSEAWEDYAVPGAPYFVLVDGAIAGEGVATTWQALASLVSDAVFEQEPVAGATAGTRRARHVDATLAASGIGPEHPSLYPGRGAL